MTTQRWYDLGTLLESKEIFRLYQEHLKTHMTLIGDTGSGKSRFLWKLLREHRRWRRGFCLIDPGDLWADILADIAREVLQTNNFDLLKKVHLLRLDPFQMARYDVFKFEYDKPIHPELLQSARRCWQHAQVHDVSEIVQLKQGQSSFEGQPRLQRVLTNVLEFVSSEVNGKRLALPDGIILLDFTHERYQEIYDKVAPHLPRRIRADMEVLHSLKRLEDVRRETESTINRWRSLFSATMSQMLNANGTQPSFSWPRAIRGGHIVLVCVQKTPFVSDDENLALAQLVIHDVFSTMNSTPRELRPKRGFTIVIDEAHQFINNPNIEKMLNVSRKYELGWVFSSVSINDFKTRHADLRPTILGVPRTLGVFHTGGWPDDLRLLGRILGRGHRDYTELVHTSKVHEGAYEWLQVTDTSEARGTQTRWQTGRTKSATKGRSKQHSISDAVGANWSNARTWNDSEGDSTAHSENSSASNARGISESPVLEGTTLIGKLDNRHEQIGAQHGSADSHTKTRTNSKGGSEHEGGNVTHTEGESVGVSESETEGTNETIGGGANTTHTESHKWVHLPVFVEKEEPTGKLKIDLTVQDEQFCDRLDALQQRQACFKLPGQTKSVFIETADVPDPFRSPKAQMEAVDWVIRQLYATHDYSFTPDFDPQQSDRQLCEFLDDDVSPDHVAETEHNNSSADGAATRRANRTQRRPHKQTRNGSSQPKVGDDPFIQ